MAIDQELKRIILILGGKGGTGKTLHCRLLYYYLIKLGVKVLAYDADIENPEFEEYHERSEHKISSIDFLDVAEAKRFFTEIDRQKPEVVLMDMPGASGRATREQFETFGVFRIAEKLGYRLTIDTVLNNAYNTINSLDVMLDYCANRADYVAVRSLLWQQGSLNFERWEASDTRKKFLELSGIEIEMPVLEASTCDELHGKDKKPALSFFESEKLEFGDRLLVESFLERSKLQLDLAAQYLGLPTPAKTNPSKKKVATTEGVSANG